MKSLLLMSMMFALIGVPLLTAREKSAVRALQRMLMIWGGFALFYLFAMQFIYPHL